MTKKIIICRYRYLLKNVIYYNYFTGEDSYSKMANMPISYIQYMLLGQFFLFPSTCLRVPVPILSWPLFRCRDGEPHPAVPGDGGAAGGGHQDRGQPRDSGRLGAGHGRVRGSPDPGIHEVCDSGRVFHPYLFYTDPDTASFFILT